jgi:hypothetical protein
LFTIRADQANLIGSNLLINSLFRYHFLGLSLETLNPDYKNLLLTGNEEGEIS